MSGLRDIDKELNRLECIELNRFDRSNWGRYVTGVMESWNRSGDLLIDRIIEAIESQKSSVRGFICDYADPGDFSELRDEIMILLGLDGDRFVCDCRILEDSHEQFEVILGGYD